MQKLSPPIARTCDVLQRENAFRYSHTSLVQDPSYTTSGEFVFSRGCTGQEVCMSYLTWIRIMWKAWQWQSACHAGSTAEPNIVGLGPWWKHLSFGSQSNVQLVTSCDRDLVDRTPCMMHSQFQALIFWTLSYLHVNPISTMTYARDLLIKEASSLV